MYEFFFFWFTRFCLSFFQKSFDFFDVDFLNFFDIQKVFFEFVEFSLIVSLFLFILIKLSLILLSLPIFLDCDPLTIGFQLQRVVASLDLKVSVFVPIVTPRVPHNPLLVTGVILTLTDDGDIVVNLAILVARINMVWVLVVAHQRVGNDAAR